MTALENDANHFALCWLVFMATSLTPGTPLEIEAIGEDVVLKPVREEPHIRDKEGVLVFTGSATGDLLEAVKRHREERSSKIGKRANR